MSIILSNITFTISTTHVTQQEMRHKQVADIEISDVIDGALEARLTFDNGETLETPQSSIWKPPISRKVRLSSSL